MIDISVLTSTCRSNNKKRKVSCVSVVERVKIKLCASADAYSM